MRTIRHTRQYSFLDVNTRDDSYSIHPLVHEWIRSTTCSNPAVAVAAQYLCGFAIDYDHSEQGCRFRRRMLPHVTTTANELQVGVDLSDRLSVVYLEARLYKQAEVIWSRVLKARQEALGMEHLETIRTMNYLAVVLGGFGRLEAVAMHQQVLEVQRRVLGAEHPDTINVLSYLASALAILGNYKEAETMQQQAMEQLCRVQGRKHHDTIRAMVELACIRYSLKRRENAEELLRSALSLGRDELGLTHPTTIRAMRILAKVCDRLQKKDEAAELRAEVERIMSSWNS